MLPDLLTARSENFAVPSAKRAVTANTPSVPAKAAPSSMARVRERMLMEAVGRISVCDSKFTRISSSLTQLVAMIAIEASGRRVFFITLIFLCRQGKVEAWKNSPGGVFVILKSVVVFSRLLVVFVVKAVVFVLTLQN